MKKILFFLAVSALVFSCKKDKPSTTVNLHFKALYGGVPLVMNSQYQYPGDGGTQVMIQQFNFYISDIVLLDENGGETKVLDVDFVDFTENTTAAEAETPATFTRSKIPTGTYTGLRMGIGVPADKNKASANQLSPGNPLRDTYSSHFWTDWGSFIFLKSEGIYDYDQDGVIENNGEDHPYGHHCGTNESHSSVTFNQPIVLEENKAADLNFVVDLLKLYANDDGVLDFGDSANLYTHNPNDLTLAKKIMGNFHFALTLE
ncbi:MAG: MbnP family protein [Saprospiraceae bacterium]